MSPLRRLPDAISDWLERPSGPHKANTFDWLVSCKSLDSRSVDASFKEHSAASAVFIDTRMMFTKIRGFRVLAISETRDGRKCRLLHFSHFTNDMAEAYKGSGVRYGSESGTSP